MSDHGEGKGKMLVRFADPNAVSRPTSVFNQRATGKRYEARRGVIERRPSTTLSSQERRAADDSIHKPSASPGGMINDRPDAEVRRYVRTYVRGRRTVLLPRILERRRISTTRYVAYPSFWGDVLSLGQKLRSMTAALARVPLAARRHVTR